MFCPSHSIGFVWWLNKNGGGICDCYLQFPIPVAARSKAWVCGLSLAGIAGSNPSEAWMSVSCDYCVLSRNRPCVGLITGPETPTECGWSDCNREASIKGRSCPSRRCCAKKKRKYFWLCLLPDLIKLKMSGHKQISPHGRLHAECDPHKQHWYLQPTLHFALWQEVLRISVCYSAICCISLSRFSTESQFVNPYPTAFPYGNGMVLHFYQQQESSTTKTVHKVINKGLKAYV